MFLLLMNDWPISDSYFKLSFNIFQCWISAHDSHKVASYITAGENETDEESIDFVEAIVNLKG